MKFPLSWTTAVLLFIPRLAGAAPTVTPEQVQAALPKLDQLVEQTLKKTGVPGLAVAVVYRDQVVYLKGFGVRQLGQPEPVDGDTVFPMASVSKPMATTVLAALVGEGLIRWDDRVIDHDPGFRLLDPWVTRAVTLRDLLCHRSGLPDHAGDLLEDLGFERAEILFRLRFLKPAYSLRAGYAYTNFGFTEAALAGARASGKSWEDLCAEKLYRPLGMRATSSRHADFAAAANRARPHERRAGQWVLGTGRQPDAQSPAGGVSASARDLAQWLRLQLADGQWEGKPLIAAGALAETHRPQVITRPPANPASDRAGFYGLGWNVNYDDRGRVLLGHSGVFDLGAATAVYLMPGEQFGILALSNAAPVGATEAIALTFIDLVLAGRSERDWLQIVGDSYRNLAGNPPDYSRPPAKPMPPLPTAAYVGDYHNDFFGAIAVAAKGEALELRLGPKKLPYPLRHWDRDVFIYQPTGEMAAGPSAVVFQIGPERQAATVRIEHLDPYGQGTFRRVMSGK